MLISGYLFAVILGTRTRRFDGRIATILFLCGVVQLVVVLISMFLMEPPSLAPHGH
jgi:hypothetical protein